MSGSNLDLLDVLNIMSFAIGIANYGENLSQGDMQEIAGALDRHTSEAIADVHEHLKDQDAKISEILEILKK